MKVMCVHVITFFPFYQSFMVELETSQTMSFTVFRQSSVVAQLEIPVRTFIIIYGVQLRSYFALRFKEA